MPMRLHGLLCLRTRGFIMAKFSSRVSDLAVKKDKVVVSIGTMAIGELRGKVAITKRPVKDNPNLLNVSLRLGIISVLGVFDGNDKLENVPVAEFDAIEKEILTVIKAGGADTEILVAQQAFLVAAEKAAKKRLENKNKPKAVAEDFDEAALDVIEPDAEVAAE